MFAFLRGTKKKEKKMNVCEFSTENACSTTNGNFIGCETSCFHKTSVSRKFELAHSFYALKKVKGEKNDR